MKYKASQREINMPVDKKLQRKILHDFCHVLGHFTFWFIMFLNAIM